MEAKDFVLLMMIPIILVGIVVYTQSAPEITGFAAAQQEQSRIYGTYSINPSFKAKIGYDFGNDYKNIKDLLKKLTGECGKRQDMEQCFKEKSALLGLSCPEPKQDSKEEAISVLDDFVNKFNECLSMENGSVCRFNFSERNLQSKILNIKLTSEFSQVKAELMEGNSVVAARYIAQEDTLYIGNYNKKDSERRSANEINILVRFVAKKPGIMAAFAVAIDNSAKIDLSKSLLYKTNEEVKFIDVAIEDSFKAPLPANKIISLPRTKGMVLCFSAVNQVNANPILYKFAVTFPKPPPKPVENLEILDALKAENSAILAWDKSDEVNSYSIYYSANNFISIKMNNIKKDNSIGKKSISNEPIEIQDIDLADCSINPAGAPCRYGIFNNPLEKNKLYYWASQNKMVYVIDGIKDDAQYSYAVTSVDDQGGEIDNDNSAEGNTYILALGKNYKSFISKDDLAPDKVAGLQQAPTAEQSTIKLVWKKPEKNIDGSASADISGFNVYYKKLPLTSPEFEAFDPRLYAKLKITSQDAQCEPLIKTACEYDLNGLEQNRIYMIAVTAADRNGNEYHENTDVKSMAVTAS